MYKYFLWVWVHHTLNKRPILMRLDPLCEPRELFDRIRIDFCKGMSSDEEDEFSESLAQVSRQTIAMYDYA